MRHQEDLKKKALKEGHMGSQMEESEDLDMDTFYEGECGELPDIEGVADAKLSIEKLAMISEGLNQLPPKLRRTFFMRHYLGMKIGAENSKNNPEGEVTIAQHFGCSARTIRNWLKEAEELLTAFREKNDEK